MMSVALGCNAQSNRQLRDSIKIVNNTLALYPDSVELRLLKASYNLQLEQWEYAKNEYDEVIKRQPYNLTALFYRAYSNDKLGRHAFAHRDYETVLSYQPDNFEAQLGMALVCQKEKLYTEAFDLMNRMVHQFPDSAIVYAIRAGIEKERNMLSLAEYDYSEAIIRDPQNTDYILNRADVRILEGKNKEAKDDLDTLLKLGVPRTGLIEYYRRCK